MECLYKLVSEDYLVDIFNDNNSIDIHVPKKRRKRQFRWTHSATLERTEEEFLKHYANKLASVSLDRSMFVVESDEIKVSIKYYSYYRFRTVGTHYFRTKKNLLYLTYNKKTKVVYVGKKNGKVSSIRSNPFASREIDSFTASIYNLMKSRIPTKNKTTLRDMNSEYWKIIGCFTKECFGVEMVSGSLQDLFLENYIKIHNIIAPDNYNIFFKSDQPTLREIKRAKNNLLLAIEKKHKLKGKKFHRVLHSLQTEFHPYLMKELITFFGLDKIKQLPDGDLRAILEQNSYYSSINIGEYVDEFNPQEKKRMMDIFLDCIRNNGSYHTFSDHIKFLIKLKYQYNDSHTWESRNRDEFTKEHVYLSNLISKYENGIYDRTYTQDFIDTLKTELVHNGGVYYPVVLCSDFQYKDESEVQHNCVKTYTKNVKSCIISLREGSPSSEVRATIQYSFIPDNNKISLTRLQTLGRFNKSLSDNWNKPVAMLDELMEQAIRKFNVEDYKITKTTQMETKVYNVTQEFTVMFDDEKKSNFFDIDW